MSFLDSFFYLFLGSLVLVLIFRNNFIIKKLAPALYFIQLLLLIQMYINSNGFSPASSFNIEELKLSLVNIHLLGFELKWRFDSLSWFFSMITVATALITSIFMSGDWGKQYDLQSKSHNKTNNNSSALGMLHVSLMFNVVSMLILLSSGDLLSLFIGWELVSWASFSMMFLSPNSHARKSAVTYLIYAMTGAMSLLAALSITFFSTGSLDYVQITQAVPQVEQTSLWLMVILFVIAFTIKMGLLPFHLWQAEAYAETPGPGSAFLGAISSRMGMYTILVVLVQIIGVTQLNRLEFFYNFISLQQLLAWLAALTVVIPTYIALQQHDAKRLLAWHGIGQGGYMLMGVMMFDSIGTAGGIMHIFNHASYQAALFLTVVAVVYRTGTSDLNKLGGLVTRMPFTFLVMLVGIIGLAGLPPMNGFVSKWLVYRSLLINGEPLLFVAAVLGTLGTILSVYKLIHNTFLGQLRIEHQEVKEVPLSMLIPMLILAAIVFITGFMPGLILPWIASIQQTIGLPVIEYHLGGISYIKGGLDMLWITGVLFYGFFIGAIIFYFIGGKSKRVHQFDNYAGGHFLSSDVQYHYSNNFYPGLMHLIGSWYKGIFKWTEQVIVSIISFSASLAENMYRTRQPILMLSIVIFFSLLTFFIGENP